MRIFLKVATAKSGAKYHALCVERWGVEKTLTFDIEAILLVTGMTMEQVYNLPMGKHAIKI